MIIKKYFEYLLVPEAISAFNDLTSECGACLDALQVLGAITVNREASGAKVVTPVQARTGIEITNDRGQVS